MKPCLHLPGKLLVVRSFFDAEFCSRICDKSSSAARSPARVGIGKKKPINRRFRSAEYVRLSPYDRSAIRKRMLSLLPHLSKCFRVSLSDLQTVQVLSYRRGDFFTRHIDNPNRPDMPAFITRRKVSLVVFMNHGDGEAGRRDYSGGNLNLYDVTTTGTRLSVSGEPGMLVAFRSSTLHEVTPVRSGERLTVVGWVC